MFSVDLLHADLWEENTDDDDDDDDDDDEEEGSSTTTTTTTSKQKKSLSLFLNAQNKEGNTPLHLCTQNKNWKEALVLLNAGSLSFFFMFPLCVCVYVCMYVSHFSSLL